MPLTLVPPKVGRTPNYHIRGSYLGVAVNRSAKTPVKDIAKRLKKRIEEAIEQGIYKPDGMPKTHRSPSSPPPWLT